MEDVINYLRLFSQSDELGCTSTKGVNSAAGWKTRDS